MELQQFKGHVMGKNLLKLFFGVSMLCPMASINASAPLTEIEYKTTLGIVNTSALGSTKSPYELVQNVKIPVLSNLSHLKNSDFTPLDHERFEEWGFEPFPQSKAFQFAAPYTSLSMTCLWPLALYQLACIDNMSDPDHVILRPGREFLHQASIVNREFNRGFGIHTAYMTAQLMLPIDFDPASGEKLSTLIYVTGTTGRRLTEESFAIKFNDYNCAVLLVDPRQFVGGEDQKHRHLDRDLLGMGGAINKFQEVLATAPFLNKEVSIFGDSIGGLLVWLSIQKEIYEKYTHPMDIRAIAIANIPPVMSFKSSFQHPPQVPLCLIHGDSDEFILPRMVNEWKAYGNLPYGIRSVPGGHHDFLANPIDLSTLQNGQITLKRKQDIGRFPIVEISLTPEEVFAIMHPRFLSSSTPLNSILSGSVLADIACVTPLQLKVYDDQDTKVQILEGTSAKTHAALAGPQRHDEFYAKLTTGSKKDPVTFAPMEDIKARKKIRNFIASNLLRVLPQAENLAKNKKAKPEGHKVDKAFSKIGRSSLHN